MSRSDSPYRHDDTPSASIKLPPLLEEILSEITGEDIRATGSFTLALVEKVARRRNRPIHLSPMEMLEEEQFGVWLEGEQFDYIFFEKNTARVHQEHAIVHELSHMLLGHRTYRVRPDSVATNAILMRTLCRSSKEEREAEELATVIQEAFLEQSGLEALAQVSTTPIWSSLILGLGVVDE